MDAGVSDAEILRTKLYPPRLPSIVPRREVIEGLRKASSSRLITIIAGAGYGKSTLAAEFLAESKAPFVWYQLEETDADLSTFLTYLVHGIRMKDSEFGSRTLERLRSAANVTTEYQEICAVLLSEIDEWLEGELFIALDDFHSMEGSASIEATLQFLISHSPPGLHFILLSRRRTGLDLSGLAARRELHEVEERDLCFTGPEARTLFYEVFDLPLSDDELLDLHELTEGWVSGLVLVYLAIKGKSRVGMEETIRSFGSHPAKVYDYLTRAIWQRQDEETKEFLMKTSILSRLNPAFCDELLHINNSKGILEHLTDSRMFTNPLDDAGEWYRYHHLLRSLLLETLEERLEALEIARLNRDAALLWEERCDPEQALAHYMEAGELDRAADVLEQIAPGLMEGSRISFLKDQLGMLPDKVLGERPSLLFHLGEIAFIQAKYETALEHYERAVTLFGASGDVESQARALSKARLMNYTYLQRFDDAARLMEKLRQLVPIGSPLWYGVASEMSAVAYITGDYELADEFLAETLEHIDEVADELTKANALFWCGFTSFARYNYRQAIDILPRAAELAERNNLTLNTMNCYGMLVACLTCEGMFGEALELARSNIKLVESLDFETPTKFLFHAGLAMALLNMNDEGAREELEFAASLSGKYDVGLDVLLAEYTLGLALMRFGEISRARKHFEIANRGGRELEYFASTYITGLGLLWSSYLDRDIDELIGEVRETIDAYSRAGVSGNPTPSGYLVVAFLELLAGRREEALEALRTAAEVTEELGGVGYWRYHCTQEFGELALPLLTEMFSRGEHMETLRRVFGYVGPASIPYLRSLDKSKDAGVREGAKEIIEGIRRKTAEPLVVRMLGPFEIHKGDSMLRAEDWKSRRALSVFKYLAAQEQNRLVPRDMLMDLLWPDTDPGSAAKNLNVALSSLRKTLEPDAARGESSYLVASGDSLRLELGNGGSVDFRLFEDALAEAAAHKNSRKHDLFLDRMLEAERLYDGDFLAEDPYEDWCRPARDGLSEQYMKLLIEISGEFLRKGDPQAALGYCEKGVKRNPGSESLCRTQMEIFGRLGDRAGVERSFRCCRDYLQDNFQVEPSRDTLELYNRLRVE